MVLSDFNKRSNFLFCSPFFLLKSTSMFKILRITLRKWYESLSGNSWNESGKTRIIRKGRWGQRGQIWMRNMLESVQPISNSNAKGQIVSTNEPSWNQISLSSMSEVPKTENWISVIPINGLRKNFRQTTGRRSLNLSNRYENDQGLYHLLVTWRIDGHSKWQWRHLEKWRSLLMNDHLRHFYWRHIY